MTPRSAPPALAWPLALALGACTGLGPRTIPRDRFDYIHALRESWKEQVLVNVVGLRFMELPVFLEVTSVINQYRLEGSVEGTLGTGEDSGTLGASLYDQPTITYVPLSGEQFTRGLMTPISPASVASMLQAGWPAGLVLRVAVRAINGIGAQHDGAENPEYLRLVERIQRLQQSAGLGARIVQRGEGQTVILFLPGPEAASVTEDVRAVQQALGLAPGLHEIELVYGKVAENDRQMAVLTRSIMELLIELGRWVDIPPEDVAEGRTPPTRKALEVDGRAEPLIRIHSGPEAPAEAFVRVRLRERWYWVDDRDLTSKRTFAFVMLLMSMARATAAASGRWSR